MVAGIPHGEAVPEKSGEYPDYLDRTGIPDHRATKGNRAVHVLRGIEGCRAHFPTLSFRDSMEKVRY